MNWPLHLMERDTSTSESWLLQPHTQIPNRTSASSEQGMAGVANTAVSGSSNNSALGPPNDRHVAEMQVLDQAPQQLHAQYTTELK